MGYIAAESHKQQSYHISPRLLSPSPCSSACDAAWPSSTISALSSAPSSTPLWDVTSLLLSSAST